jgi:hypothetical protein
VPYTALDVGPRFVYSPISQAFAAPAVDPDPLTVDHLNDVLRFFGHYSVGVLWFRLHA